MSTIDVSAPIAADRTPLTSPYAKYNLRRNPFGELTSEERAELAIVDPEQWLEPLQRPSTALQFIGEKGHGKTTHLLAVRKMLGNACYVYLPEDGPLPPIPSDRPLLIDEAQRLGRRDRRRIFAVGGPLVLGTHEDLASELRRWNLAVITVDVMANRTAEQLARILNTRIESSRGSKGPVPRITLEYARVLLQTLGTDVRHIEQCLYDQFQDAAHKGQLWPPAI